MPRQLLLADDSITIQKVIALTFAGEDYKIVTVDNGEDAIAKAREISPDIILADVIMPKKNGYEVCDAIKKDPALKGIPVLLLAGTFEPFDEELAKKVGANGHVIKPFESQVLIQKVKEFIGGAPSAAPRPAVHAAPPQAVKPPVPPAPAVAKPAPSAPVAKPAAPAAPVTAPPAPAPRPAPPASAAPAAPKPPAPQPPRPSAAVQPVAPPVPRPAVAAPAAPAVKPSVPVPSAAAPVVKPAAPAAPAAPPKPVPAPAPQPAKAAPAPKPPSEEDFWGTMMEEVEEKVSKKEAPPAAAPEEEAEEVWDVGEFGEEAPEEEIAEADVWGSALGEEEVPSAVEIETVSVEEPPVGEEEAFVFGEMEEGEVVEEAAEFADEFEVLGEEEAPAEEVTFGEEAPEEDMVFGEAISEEEAFAEEIPAEEVGYGEEPPVTQEPSRYVEPQPEIMQAYEQTFEPGDISARAETPAAPVSIPSAAVSATPSEEQLRAAVNNLSREMIEKIVWEVVPDLAETLIKEEIKRLQKK